MSLKLNRDLKLIAISNLMGAVGDGLYFYIFPLYILELKADPIQLGALFSILYFFSAITLIPGGLLADKYDRKKLIILTWVLSAPTPLIYSMATNWSQLLPGVVLWGLAMIGTPAFSAYTVTAAPKQNLSYVLSIVMGSYSIGQIFSPTLGGYLSTIIGMKGVLRLSFIFIVSCTFICFFISSQHAPRKPVQTQPSKVAKSNRMKMLYWAVFLGAISFVRFIPKPYTPTFFQHEIGLNNLFIGVLGSAIFLGSTVLGIILCRIGDQWGRERIIFVCTITYTVAVGLLISFPNFLILFLASFLIGGTQKIGTLVSSIVGMFAPEATRARWLAIPQTASMLGAFFAPFLGGFLYGFSPYYPFVAAILATPFLAILALTKTLWKRKVK